MDDEVRLIRAAQITVRAICERFPPGQEREKWLRWLQATLEKHGRPDQ